MKLQREDIHPLQDTCPYFGSEEYRGFVSIEAANIGDAAVILAPGARHELGLEISIG